MSTSKKNMTPQPKQESVETILIDMLKCFVDFMAVIGIVTTMALTFCYAWGYFG